MADGSFKPIEKVKAGDKVESRGPVTRKTEAKRVISPIVKHSTSLVTPALADKPNGKPVETITATTNHPVYVRGRGFVPAGELGVGTQIVTRAGPLLWVAGSHVEASTASVRVYNLDVADFHSFFVGGAAGGVWVHNIGSTCPPTPRVIGESMDRVRAYANATGYLAYEPRGGVTFAKNMRILDDDMRRGRPIIDIGRDERRPLNPSPFYNGELDRTSGYRGLVYDPQP